MKIRAITKLLKISRIKPEADPSELLTTMPGEWYAGLISLGKPEKMGIQFLHYPTYISLFIPTKSLNQAITILPAQVKAYLNRNGFETLIPQFELNSKPEIFKTNSRSMLGHLNQLKFSYEYHCANTFKVEEIDFAKLEDYNLTYLFGSAKTPGKYLQPIDLLKELIETT